MGNSYAGQLNRSDSIRCILKSGIHGYSFIINTCKHDIKVGQIVHIAGDRNERGN